MPPTMARGLPILFSAKKKKKKEGREKERRKQAWVSPVTDAE